MLPFAIVAIAAIPVQSILFCASVVGVLSCFEIGTFVIYLGLVAIKLGHGLLSFVFSFRPARTQSVPY